MPTSITGKILFRLLNAGRSNRLILGHMSLALHEAWQALATDSRGR